MHNEKIDDQIVSIFRGIFNEEKISIDDDFFDLGGDSLSATRFIVDIKKIFNLDVSMHEFFRDTSVRGISSLITHKIKSVKEGVDVGVLEL